MTTDFGAFRSLRRSSKTFSGQDFQVIDVAIFYYGVFNMLTRLPECDSKCGSVIIDFVFVLYMVCETNVYNVRMVFQVLGRDQSLVFSSFRFCIVLRLCFNDFGASEGSNRNS